MPTVRQWFDEDAECNDPECGFGYSAAAMRRHILRSDKNEKETKEIREEKTKSKLARYEKSSGSNKKNRSN